MALHELAGEPAPKSFLIDVKALISAYYANVPDVVNPVQRVAFGTSGHRGTSLDASFTEAHILAITQAICEYRAKNGIDGPLFIGRDTHALSAPAETSALEVLAANGVRALISANGEPTPTPAVSHAILTYNNDRTAGLADGIVITPSHNPPADGGFKYNPPHGGPADTDATKWIENRANSLLQKKNAEVRRAARPSAERHDFLTAFVNDLSSVVDITAIAASSLRVAVDPLGGASLAYWVRIAEQHKLDLSIVNDSQDPAFGFMTLDHDGKIRMDCSSPFAMAPLLELRSSFDLAFGNDPDSDRHGIVTPTHGLLNPNHYLAACVYYLFRNRPAWPGGAAVGKTLVSSSVIDRISKVIGRTVFEVPVGFKWFVPGLLDGSLGFGGEESAGASFLRFDGTPWSTDKDGIILNLLACEMTAKVGKNPGQIFDDIVSLVGRPYYRRVDQAITHAEKEQFKNLTPRNISAEEVAGEPIAAILTNATGNGAPIGGVKIEVESGWFAARPSGTESIYKLYAESMKSEEHLDRILSDAQQIVKSALSPQSKP